MSELKQVDVTVTKKSSGVSKSLDSYFHFTDKGSSMGQEVKAGLSVFFISACALFMNIQIVIQAFSDNIPYCGMYLGATITAFVGTLLLGILCNLPLVQTSSLSMSTVMISILGTDSGLTYANLLALTLVAALVYLVVMAVPALRKFVYHMIPESVRSAFPVAIGLYIIYTALNNMGLLDGMSLAAISDTVLGGAAVAPYIKFCFLAGLIGLALILFNKKRKSDTPVMSGFLAATLIFFLIASVVGGIIFNYVYTQNRIWVGVNPDPLGEMYTIALGFKELQIGTVFKEGFDFSAFTAAGGNVVWLFVRSILLFVFMGMYESEAAVQGADLNGEIIEEGKYEKAAGKFLLANAVTNVLAPVFGAAPVSVGKQSAAAAADGGKTGLSSVVCAIGYLVSMFTWLPFVIFATYTKSVPEYGHAGFVFPNVIYAAFQIADAAMLVLGLMMLKGCRRVKDMTAEEILAFAATISMTVFTQNLAYGVAAGAVVSVFQTLASLKKAEIKSAKASNYVMAVLSVVLLSVSLVVPSLGGNAAGQTGIVSGTETENSAGFSFDNTTGDFVFTGNEEAEYYAVWVYALDAEGVEVDSYVAASSRLSGSGEITGNVDISALPFGTYHANLITFNKSGENPQPISIAFTVSGKLSVPEFKYVQDGTKVTITLDSNTLTTYNEKELFTEIAVNVYDENGELVTTETITPDDMTAMAMGPMKSYSCEKEITLEEGDYQISLTAKGDGNIAEGSDESEKISLVVKSGAETEGQTSGYTEQQGGMPGMPGGGMPGEGGAPDEGGMPGMPGESGVPDEGGVPEDAGMPDSPQMP